jgi:hypothetical protein
MGFDRLIRFEDDGGNVHYGNIPQEFPSGGVLGTKVQVLKGDLSSGFSIGQEQATLKKVNIFSPIRMLVRAYAHSSCYALWKPPPLYHASDSTIENMQMRLM